MSRPFIGAAAACVAAALATPASAHVTLDPPQAAADSFFKFNVRVSHGCEGTPTVRLRVRIPAGVSGVKPQPKPGWDLTTVRTKLNPPIKDSHGGAITEAVTEVIWSGGKLRDEHYDEFGIHMKLPNKPNTILYFPAVQECEKGVHRWIEIPEPGKKWGDYKSPAPMLKLGPKAGGH